MREASMLTTNEVAERLNVSQRRVRALIETGRLPSQQYGRDHLIKESDLKLVADRPTGRPRKQPAAPPQTASAKTTQKLNEAFREATESEAGKKKGGKK